MKYLIKIFGVTHQANNLWFSSDFHYNHAGIVRGTSNWDDKKATRDFDTLEEHDAALVANINACVKEDDILVSCGDWSFGDYKTGANVSNIRKFREQLNCKRIIHVYGNHDEEIRKNSDNTKDLFLWIGDYLELTVLKITDEQGVKPYRQKVVCCHYAMKTWHNSGKGAYMFFGHSHSSLGEQKGKTKDVGIDCHPKLMPFSYEELDLEMKNKSIEIVDHHI